jgi:rod shape-determining protein MreD
MKRNFFLLIILAFCLILPGTVFHYWSWAGIKPDLAMLWVIYVVLHQRPPQGVLFGFLAGLIADMYFGRYIGLYAITLMVVALIISFMQQRWYRDNIPLTMVLVFMATALGQTLIVILAKMTGLNWFFGDALRIIFGISLYNSLLVPITYPFVHRSFTSGLLQQKSKFEQ